MQGQDLGSRDLASIKRASDCGQPSDLARNVDRQAVDFAEGIIDLRYGQRPPSLAAARQAGAYKKRNTAYRQAGFVAANAGVRFMSELETMFDAHPRGFSPNDLALYVFLIRSIQGGALSKKHRLIDYPAVPAGLSWRAPIHHQAHQGASRGSPPESRAMNLVVLVGGREIGLRPGPWPGRRFTIRVPAFARMSGL